MVDFEILFVEGRPVMTHNRVDSIVNNMYLSIMIKKGYYIYAPFLGSRLHTIKKITADGLRLCRDYIVEALAWIVDSKRIYDLSVVATLDSSDTSRINISVSAKKQNGQEVTFETFYRVV
jgi:phage gp46-like protein